MRIINIVDRLDRVNFGIWNAAISTAAELKRQYDADSEIWFPAETNEAEPGELNGAFPRALSGRDLALLDIIIEESQLNCMKDIIVTHGCWRYPTKWGRALKKKGFQWMAVPQGMLEPWSVSQKRMQKWIYYHLLERPALQIADKVRAVGRPEFENLVKVFENQLIWIPNGVPLAERDEENKKSGSPIIFLFMARLHHKKGILPLVQGWLNSSLADSTEYLLNIAGPDDGELDQLNFLMEKKPNLRNVEIVGPVYGQAKKELLQRAHFYVLPSFSEGFPTSVLEAMQNRLIPIISDGCNFPEVFENDLGIRVSPNTDSIRRGIEEAKKLSQEDMKRKMMLVHQFIQDKYTNHKLATDLFQVLKDMETNSNA